MIPEFKSAFETKLRSNATITGNVDDIYFVKAPRSVNPNTTKGFIVWTSTFGDNIPYQGKGNYIEIADLTLGIYAPSLLTVATLQRQVLTTIDDATLSITNYTHIQTMRSGGNLPPEQEEDTNLWHQAVLYEVMYD